MPVAVAGAKDVRTCVVDSSSATRQGGDDH